jgi:hypothetical protein
VGCECVCVCRVTQLDTQLRTTTRRERAKIAFQEKWVEVSTLDQLSPMLYSQAKSLLNSITALGEASVKGTSVGDKVRTGARNKRAMSAREVVASSGVLERGEVVGSKRSKVTAPPASQKLGDVVCEARVGLTVWIAQTVNGGTELWKGQMDSDLQGSGNDKWCNVTFFSDKSTAWYYARELQLTETASILAAAKTWGKAAAESPRVYS